MEDECPYCSGTGKVCECCLHPFDECRCDETCNENEVIDCYRCHGFGRIETEEDE